MSKSLGKKEKALIQELEVQTKDIRGQFVEQLKCLEQRTETQVAMLGELQDFYRRKADLELEHSKNLEKLVKSLSSRHKAEKQRREPWAQHCMLGVWQQLLDDTKLEAKHHSALSDLYTHHVTAKLTNHSEDMQRIARKCREIGGTAHQQVSRVLSELHTAMKSYQLCYAESSAVEAKFRVVEQHKFKFEQSYPQKVPSSRKYRVIEREFDKKLIKFQEFRLKALKARNEYLLCVDAANAALHRYFAVDLSDLIDCTDLGLQHWMSHLIGTVVTARKTICQSEMTALAELSVLAETLDSRLDKQRFIEANRTTFMLPRRFEFRPHGADSIRQVSAQKAVQEELLQRLTQIRRRLTDLKIESEEVWKTLETAEKRVIELQREPVVPIEDYFVSDLPATPAPGESKKSCRENEFSIQKRKLELAETEDFYLEKFEHYLLNSNLIDRLTARHDAIRRALEGRAPDEIVGNQRDSVQIVRTNGVETNGHVTRPNALTYSRTDSQGSAGSEPSTPVSSGSEDPLNTRPPTLPPKPRRKRIGLSCSPTSDRRPKLFGGSLEEYVEATEEQIPLVMVSCVRMLSMFALHHQGVFRVSGSQLEINRMKETFERGDDPLVSEEIDGGDVNSVAGVLKLYLRELREPMFPVYMFNQFCDCAQITDRETFISEVHSLITNLPAPVVVVLRYLFAFLNHLSEFSDENMMDPYNLAICFGPTLLPIPEGKDQVFYHNFVNELVKNMILYHDYIFPQDLPGPVYEKFLISDTEEIEETDGSEAVILEEDYSEHKNMLESIICSLPAVDDDLSEPIISQQPLGAYSHVTLPLQSAPPRLAEKPDWLKRYSATESEPTEDHYYFSLDPNKSSRSRSQSAGPNPAPSPPTSIHEIQNELKAVLTSLEQISLASKEPDLVQNLPAGQSPSSSSSGESDATLKEKLEKLSQLSPRSQPPVPPKPLPLSHFKWPPDPECSCEVEKL